MANNKVIELTQQELEDIKDEVKFRTMVMMTLKSLKGIPATVNSLCIHRVIHWFFISVILIYIVSIALGR